MKKLLCYLSALRQDEGAGCKFKVRHSFPTFPLRKSTHWREGALLRNYDRLKNISSSKITLILQKPPPTRR